MTAADMEMLRGTAEVCQIHRTHSPRSHINHRHHIHPLGDGGANEPGNIVVVCPTGHNNIHRLLDLYKKHHGTVPYADARYFTSGERRYAKLGYEQIAKKSAT